MPHGSIGLYATPALALRRGLRIAPTAQALPTRNGGLVFIKDRMTRQFVDGQETDVIDAIPE